ncbi:MAG: hypothetical protein JNM62_02475 [Flavobacteriales bacterium]|nr:hypothetical protein [Flavobacteriales bacterium]
MKLLLALLSLTCGLQMDAQTRTWSWAWGAGSVGYEEAYVAVAPGGAVHVYGSFSNTLDANGATLTSIGESDGFVQELDPDDGSVLWTAMAHHTGNVYVYDVAYRSTGELVVCGTVEHNGGTVQFGTHTLAGQQFGTQAFVAGVSATGQWSWVSGIAGAVSTSGFHVEVDANDNVLLGCSYGTGLAVYRLTGQGQQSWQAVATTTGSSVDLYGMDVLPSGDLVVTGRCYGTGTFGTHSVVVGGIYYDAFVARLSAVGQWQWVAQAGGSHWDKGFAVCADAVGDVYVAGTFRNTADFGTTSLTATGSNNDGWLAKLDGNGQWLWAVQMGSVAYMEVYAMAMNATGERLAITGSYAFNTPTIGGITLPAPPNAQNEIHVLEYSTAGEVLGALGAGGTGGDRGYAVAYNAVGALFVAGVNGADMQLGAHALTGVGTPDLWVGRLDADLSTSVAMGTTEGQGTLYYDPAQQQIRFKGFEGSLWQVELTDAVGKRLATGSTSNTMAVPDALAAGLVLATLTRGEERRTMRIALLR